MGIAGACRKDELRLMTMDDIEDLGSILLVKIPDSKTKIERSFTVTSGDGLNLLEYYRKYALLRPQHTKHKQFFVHYRGGKCSTQVVGQHIFGKIPYRIANYLQLEDSAAYTGHTFRRTSATLLVNAGADITNLKRHGGWKSTSVAEGYIENSLQNKLEIANRILGEAVPASSNDSHETVDIAVSSNDNSGSTQVVENKINSSLNNIPNGINITNCKDITVNFHFH